MSNESKRVFGRTVATSLTDHEQARVAGGVKPEFTPATTATTFCDNDGDIRLDSDYCTS